MSYYLESDQDALSHVQAAADFLNKNSITQADSTFQYALGSFKKNENWVGVLWTYTERAILAGKKDTTKALIDSLVEDMKIISSHINHPDMKSWARATVEFSAGLKWYGGKPYKVDSALLHLQELEAYCEKNVNKNLDGLLANIYYSLGDIHFSELDNYSLASRYLEKSLLISMQKAPDLRFSRQLYTYARIKAEMGEYDYALQLLFHTLAIRRFYVGDKHELIANAWNQIGKSYYEKGDYGEAVKAYSHAYTTMHELDKLPTYEFFYLNNLSTSLERCGEIEQAETYYQEADKLIEQQENSGPGFHQQAMLNYQNQAALYINQEKYSQAEQALKKADILNRQYEQAAFLFPENTNLLWAEFYWKTQQAAQAEEAIRRTKELCEVDIQTDEINTPEGFEPMEIVNVLRLEAQIYETFHPRIPAHLYATLDKYNSILRYIARVRWDYNLAEDQLEAAARCQEIVMHAMEISKELLDQTGDLKQVAQMFELMEQSKSQVLQQELVKGAIVQKELQHQYLRTTVRGGIPLSTSTSSAENKAEIMVRNDNLRKLIEEVHLQSAALQKSDSSFSTYDAQKPLRLVQDSLLYPGELLIEYTVSDTTIWELSLSKQAVLFRSLPLRDSLIAQITGFQEAVQSREILQRNSILKTFGHQLYQDLLEPVLDYHFSDELPTRLTIIPDGLFHHFPFELLLTAKTVTEDYREFPFVLKQFPVNYGFSCQFREANTSFRLNKLVGRKMLSLSTIEIGQLQARVNLPNGIERTELRGSEARKETWMKAAAHYDLLQIITHGFANSEEGYPYLLLNGNEKQDQRLYMGEVSALPLRAELVVLTACEGGVGRLRSGEGSLSMLRALRMSGCENLVAGLWEVHTEPLPPILEHFYASLTNGKDIPDALRQAKLSYLQQAGKRKADPVLWGALVAYSQ